MAIKGEWEKRRPVCGNRGLWGCDDGDIVHSGVVEIPEVHRYFGDYGDLSGSHRRWRGQGSKDQRLEVPRLCKAAAAEHEPLRAAFIYVHSMMVNPGTVWSCGLTLNNPF